MQTYAILRRNAWATPQELEAAGALSAKVGNEQMSDRIRWIRSYVLTEPGGGLGTVCIYQATNEEAIREHARRASLACDEIVPIGNTVVVREDPAA